MGRHKQDIDWEKEIKRLRAAIRAASAKGITPTIESLAKGLNKRKSTIIELMDNAQMKTLGQSERLSRQDGRVYQLPIIELIGLHFQYGVKVAAFAYRGFPKTRTTAKVRPLMEDMLAPSVLTLDRLRIVAFETALFSMENKVQNHHSSRIDEKLIKVAIESFKTFGNEHGYEVETFVHFQGTLSSGLEELLGFGKDPQLAKVEFPFERLLASVASSTEVSCLGPGFFPLLGDTGRKLLSMAEHPSALARFTLQIKDDDIREALAGRLRVCDALANEGLIYGAPLTKLSEMANRASGSFSRRQMQRSVAYGDGLDSKDGKRPTGNICLAAPIRLNPSLLQTIPISVSDRKPFIKIEQVKFADKNVECLVAWLPQIRDMLIRILNNPNLNARLTEWTKIQEKTITSLGSHSNSACFEIINPQAMILVGKDGKNWLDDADPGQCNQSTDGYDFRASRRDMAVGMLMTVYDPDTLIGRLMSEEDWEECRRWQKDWSDQVFLQVSKNSAKIISSANWNNRDVAEQILGKLLENRILANRLIRFILEQAALSLLLPVE